MPATAARFLAAWALAWVACAAVSAEETSAPAAQAPILGSSGVWRALYSWNAPLIQTADGMKERRVKGDRTEPTERPDFNFMTLYPPPGWTGPDLDDSTWARRHFFAKYSNGESDDRAGGGAASPYLRQLCLRGKFTVTDPARVGPIWLAATYRGGLAVYLNGKEIARAHLAAGPIEPGAPAEMYPAQAYLKEGGKPWHWYEDHEAIGKEAYPLRVRGIPKLAIPKDLLRKGVNVLAVEIHAAPYPEAFLKTEPQWASCGLIELHLRADKPDGIAANILRPPGIQVWNTNVAEQVHDVSWADPAEPLRPISMVTARNGCASGRVVVSSDQPIKKLAATLGDLVASDGKKLPATAAKVWFGKFDRLHASRWGGFNDGAFIQWGAARSGGDWTLRDDALVESPPDEVPVSAKPLRPEVSKARAADGLPPQLVDGALQPVWVVAEVPKDAAPGEYRGRLTITLGGHEPVEVPVELRVIDWALPDPVDGDYWMGMIESPEAVALAYNVEPWSDRHWLLVARSLEWIGRLGGKVLYVPLTAEGQYGNAESMALWVEGPGGKYTHDFGRVEKYVDLALKHMGKPRFIVAGVWDSCSHVSAPKPLRRDFPRFSVLDPVTGKIETADGPKHGSAEGAEFWAPVLTKMRDLLAKRGLADAMLLGYGADQQPNPATVGLFHAILPGVGWQATRHPPRGNDTLPYDGGTVPIRYQANVWGGWDNFDPATRRPYGWKFPANPSLRTWLDRNLFDACAVCQFRTACEQALLADRRGLGQIGADFWPVKGPDGRITETLIGRFPATSEGNLGIYAGQLLYPGPDGPVPTVRYQMMRENIQECEARIFLEKLLTDKPPRLPAELAAKIQDLLDERARWHRVQGFRQSLESYLSWPYSGWEARTAKLYEAAAQAAKACAPL